MSLDRNAQDDEIQKINSFNEFFSHDSDFHKFTPEGLFYIEEPDGSFTGVDNSDGEAWTENFPTFEMCNDWLNGVFEMQDLEDYSYEELRRKYYGK